jgi:hypothetical protein
MRQPRVLYGVLLFLLLGRLHAQTDATPLQDKPTYHLRVSVDEVVITFHAADGNGLAVNDLKLSELRLLANGKPPARINDSSYSRTCRSAPAFFSTPATPCKRIFPAIGRSRSSTRNRYCGDKPTRRSLWILVASRACNNLSRAIPSHSRLRFARRLHKDRAVFAVWRCLTLSFAPVFMNSGRPITRRAGTSSCSSLPVKITPAIRSERRRRHVPAQQYSHLRLSLRVATR